MNNLTIFPTLSGPGLITELILSVPALNIPQSAYTITVAKSAYKFPKLVSDVLVNETLPSNG